MKKLCDRSSVPWKNITTHSHISWFGLIALLLLVGLACNLGTVAPASTSAPTTNPALAPTMPSLPAATSAPLLTFTPSPTPTITLTPTITVTETLVPTVTSSAAMITPNGQDANCRFGPGTDYVSIGGLKVGKTALILGTNAGQSWWQIQNPGEIAGNVCWVSASVVTASGDLSAVPVTGAPAAFVTDLSVSTPAVVHGTCGGPNATMFTVSMTTNGPATVTYHVEIYNGNNTLRNATSNATRVFASFGTQTFDPGGSYSTDCGSYYIKAVVTSPNSISARADWKVVSP